MTSLVGLKRRGKRQSYTQKSIDIPTPLVFIKIDWHWSESAKLKMNTYLCSAPPQSERSLVSKEFPKSQHKAIDKRKKNVYGSSPQYSPQRGRLVEYDWWTWWRRRWRGELIVARVLLAVRVHRYAWFSKWVTFGRHGRRDLVIRWGPIEVASQVSVKAVIKPYGWQIWCVERSLKCWGSSRMANWKSGDRSFRLRPLSIQYLKVTDGSEKVTCQAALRVYGRVVCHRQLLQPTNIREVN